MFSSEISTNKAELVEFNGYGAIAANDESENNCTFFALHIFHARFKKMCNNMEID